MRQLFQLGLLLSVLAIPIYKWVHPVLIPQNRIPLDVAAMDREWDRAQEQAKVERDAKAANEVFTRFGCGWEDLSLLTARYSRAKKLPVRVVAATVAVESSCRPDAISPKGAIGLLQINEKVWKTGEDLTDPETNMKWGTQILSDYVRQYGLVEGLHRYNGMGNPTDEYSTKVLQISARR